MQVVTQTRSAARRDQARASLKKAEEVRIARAALHRRWREEGRDVALAELAEIIGDPPKWLWTLPLERLLSWVPGVGDYAIRRAVSKTQVDRYVLLEDLPVYDALAICEWALRRRERSAR